MIRFLQNKFVLLIFRYVLGFVFIYASIEKIYDPQEFATAIARYDLLPSIFINFFAVLIPWIELVCGFGLIFGYYLKENVVIYLGLMSVFTILVLISMIRGLDISCGCFGSADSTKVGLLKLSENIAILLIAVYVFIFTIKDYHVQPTEEKELE
ncbi:MAG: DoxX family membrane protein [Ignavibacteria bacterium]|nr:DoxX family membrane protein [Ignavibacteria bacterium]